MALVNTLYSPMKQSLFDNFKQIKLLVCDIDGVFSDGRLYLGNAGEELKAFHTKDGYGIKAILNAGIQVAVITGRRSHIVEQRMSALGVPHIIQGQEDKASAMQKLVKTLALDIQQVASVGDDMPDLGMFNHSAIKICVADGHPYVKQQANYVTQTKGGFGAVREICDLLLQAHGQLEKIQASSV